MVAAMRDGRVDQDVISEVAGYLGMGGSSGPCRGTDGLPPAPVFRALPGLWAGDFLCSGASQASLKSEIRLLAPGPDVR